MDTRAPRPADPPAAAAAPPAPAPAGPAASDAPAARRAGRRRWLLLAAVLLVVGAGDQATKYWAQTHLQHLPGRRITLVQDLASFTYVRNPGSAWGFLAHSDPAFRRPFFLVVNGAASLFILAIFWRLEAGQRALAAALALILGGAAGNLVDRVHLDYVVDFIDVHLGTRFRWPTFNVADIAITAGVLLLLLQMVVGSRAHRRPAAATPAGDSDPVERPPAATGSAPGARER